MCANAHASMRRRAGRKENADDARPNAEKKRKSITNEGEENKFEAEGQRKNETAKALKGTWRKKAGGWRRKKPVERGCGRAVEKCEGYEKWSGRKAGCANQWNGEKNAQAQELEKRRKTAKQANGRRKMRHRRRRRRAWERSGDGEAEETRNGG